MIFYMLGILDWLFIEDDRDRNDTLMMITSHPDQMISYKFIGKDGSMGLKNGEIYKIFLDKKWYKKQVRVHILCPDHRCFICTYNSMKTFKQNWEML